MMKKITLFLLMLVGLSLNAQIFWFDDLNDQLVIDQYTIEDADTRVIDNFYTDQGAFTNGSWDVINFGGTLGVAHFSASAFTGADSCLSTSDWLMTPVFDFTGALAPFMEFSLNATSGGEISIFATTSIAGAVPAASDFTGAALATVAATNAWAVAPTVDLSSLGNQATVYIAVVNTTTACADLVAVKDILIKNNTGIEVSLNDLSVVTDDLSNTSLVANYSILDCATGSLSVDATFTNDGPNPLADTVFLGYVFQDDLGVDFILEDTILALQTAPLASGASYTHTFSVDPDFSTSEIAVFNAFIIVNGEGDTATDNSIAHILVNPNPQDLATAPFATSFEFDFNNTSVLAQSLGWKFENNSNGFTELTIQDFSVFSDAASFVFDGDNVLVNDYIGPGGAGNFPAIDNWAFSPCMNFVTGQAYEISFYHNSIAGDIAPHTVDFSLNSAPNSTSVVAAPLSNQTFNDTILTQYTGAFVSTVTGTFNIGIHDRSAAPGFIMTYDQFEVKELPAPSVTIALSASTTDEPGVEYCDSTVTVTFSSTGTPTSLSLDWGDGTVDDVTGLTSASHSYSAYASYSIEITAANLVGSDSDNVALAFTPVPAPTITFGAPAISGNTVSVTIGTTVGTTNITYTPSCARLIIDWGDGMVEEVTGANSASHTYSGSGSFTITTTVIGGTTVDASQTIIITGIKDIDFVNALNIYPNPSNDFVNVSFGLESAQNINLSVYAVDGKVIDSRDLSNAKDVNATFNTSSYNNGVYILKVKTTDSVSTQKFVVSHN